MLKFTTYLIYSRVYRISVYYLWPLYSISIHARYCFVLIEKSSSCNDPLSEHGSPKPITILKMTPQQDVLPPPSSTVTGNKRPAPDLGRERREFFFLCPSTTSFFQFFCVFIITLYYNKIMSRKTP